MRKQTFSVFTIIKYKPHLYATTGCTASAVLQQQPSFSSAGTFTEILRDVKKKSQQTSRFINLFIFRLEKLRLTRR